MSKPKPPDDDAFVASIVDRTRSIKAQLTAHRGALRRAERMKITTVEWVFEDAVAETVVRLDGCLAGRWDAIAAAGADRAAIVADAIEYALKPLRALLADWGRDAHV
jgi:hypothetical protein